MKTINGKEITSGTILNTTDLEKVINTIYQLSEPVGMGFLHYEDEINLDEGTLNELVGAFNEHSSVYLDYVKGRCCKVMLRKVNSGEIWTSIERDKWYDHEQHQIDSFFKQVD